MSDSSSFQGTPKQTKNFEHSKKKPQQKQTLFQLPHQKKVSISSMGNFFPLGSKQLVQIDFKISALVYLSILIANCTVGAIRQLVRGS